MDLPAHFAVRDYLKQRLNMYRMFTGDDLARQMAHWTLAYGKGAISSDALRQFGEETLDCAKAAGAFGIRTHEPGCSALPLGERFSLSGFLLEPMSLGEDWQASSSTYHTENAALLRTISARFECKGASFGIGMGCIVLTQHLLERAYERIEIGRAKLASLIEADFTDLIRAQTLADAASLWVSQRSETGQALRVTAVPYSNGLMIFDERMLLGDIEGGEFGIQWEIPGARIRTPVLNPSRLVEDLGDGQLLRGNGRPARITCGVTYLDTSTFDRDESDYFYGFRALMEEVGSDTLDALAQSTLMPPYANQSADEFSVQDGFLQKTARLAELLNAGWLKPKRTQPICVLLPYDAKVARDVAIGWN